MPSANQKVNYTQITHDVVQQTYEPLAFDDLLTRVAAIAPITTKQPRQTIRNVISSSRLIAATGDQRYGWKPRIINGAKLRLRLLATDRESQRLTYTDEVCDALYPTFFESSKRSDRRPAVVSLPDGTQTAFTLEHGQAGHWGTSATAELWSWLREEHAATDDDLILMVENGDARHYSVTLERQSERDQASITARNQEFIHAIVPMTNRAYGAAIWEITSALLATGKYHHPTPPDPLNVIFASNEWQAEMDERGLINGWTPFGLEPNNPRFGSPDNLLHMLVDPNMVTLELTKPDVALADQMLTTPRRPPEHQRSGPITTYVLRVTHREHPAVWRDIEIAADQTLEDLHLSIQEAYRWDNDHLYSFFLNGRAWDDRSEVGSPWSDTPRHANAVTLDELRLKPKRKLLYLFDYGDNHEFDVEVVAVNQDTPGGSYPRVVGRKGRAPKQYL